MILPTLERIKALHEKYAPSETSFVSVFTHCQIITDIAMQLLDNHPELAVDRELVRTGCLLHDIGVYALSGDDYITHGIKGDDLLRAEGFPEELCRIASHHTGVGLKREDISRQKLPLPDRDFIAETIEERLVMYADKFHSKAPQFNAFATYLKKIEGFGEANAQRFHDLAQEFGVPDLDTLSAAYGHPIV